MNIGANFYKLLSHPEADLMSSREPDVDSYSLGAHLSKDHGCKNGEDFKSSHRSIFFKNCSDRALDYYYYITNRSKLTQPLTEGYNIPLRFNAKFKLTYKTFASKI